MKRTLPSHKAIGRDEQLELDEVRDECHRGCIEEGLTPLIDMLCTTCNEIIPVHDFYNEGNEAHSGHTFTI